MSTSSSAPAPTTAPASGGGGSSRSAPVHATVMVGGVPYTSTGADAGSAQKNAQAFADKSVARDNAASTKATLAGKTTSTGSSGGTGGSNGTSPTLVTSGSSRTNFANNTTSLQKSLANVNANPNVSVVDYLNKSGMPSDYASRAVMAAKSGIPNYTGSAAQNMQLLSTLQGSADNGTTKADQPPMNGTDKPVQPPPNGAPTDGAAGVDTSAAAGAAPVSNPDGSTTDPNDMTSGLPPEIATAFKGTLTQQDQNIQQAQATLAQAKATMQNDPAAIAAASQIESQYATLIEAMRAKNNMVLGAYKTNAARNGSLQYANDMETNFMSAEMDAASMRLGDLVTKENELVLKSNIAYQNADVKAFNAAQTAVEKATTDKQTTLGKLLTATNDHVKAVQAQQRLDMETQKNTLATDVTTSAKIADGMVQAIADAGISDQAAIDSYVQKMATANGITNPDILKSALVKAQQTAQKAGDAHAKTEYSIHKPYFKNGSGKGGSSTTKGGGTDGGYKYSADDVSTYTSLLNKGGTVNGTTYAARGKDGFVDPGTYTAAYEDWVNNNNGTPAGFAKKFPVKTNVNPASYSLLPAAIQPASSGAGSTPKYPVSSK